MKSCFLCIGSGRLGDHVVSLKPGAKEVLSPIQCPMCNGTGWVDPPPDTLEYLA